MRVVHLATSDSSGGTSIAAFRLHKQLLAAGVDSWMVVARKESTCERIVQSGGKESVISSKIKYRLEKVCWQAVFGALGIYLESGLLPCSILGPIKALNPDIIHLHWVQSGFVSSSTLRLVRVPIVWTLHDSWPIEGCTHIPLIDLRRIFADRMNPYLFAIRIRLLVLVNNLLVTYKSKVLRDLEVSYIAPSDWMLGRARSSRLSEGRRVTKIPNIVCGAGAPDPPLVKTKRTKGELLRLFYVGSPDNVNPVKGWHILIKAFRSLDPTLKSKVALFCIGTNNKQIQKGDEVVMLPPVSANSMGRYYNQMDIVVIPSYSESFSLVAAEAQAHGLPVIAFKGNAISEIITPESGYLVDEYSKQGLADALANMIKGSKDWENMSKRALNVASKLVSASDVGGKTRELYRRILSESCRVR